MKYLPILLLLFVAACNNGEMERKNAELQAKQNELDKELSSRDEYIESVTRTVNEVYDNLELIRAKEKHIVAESNAMESTKKLTQEEIRQRLLGEIASIDTTLRGNRKRIDDLQSKVNSYRAQFASLRTLVATLKKTIEEREAAIAELETKVGVLQQDVAEKAKTITERDETITRHVATIEAQTHQLSTAFYIVGTRKDLESKGIIRNQGGFLWGLLGSTTVLASGFNREYFQPINKWTEKSIDVKGSVNEIIPKRDEQLYSTADPGKKQSVITILEPKKFWQEDYLVIITD